MSDLYGLAREKFLRGEIEWLNDDIRALMVSAAYTPNFITDEFVSAISAGARSEASDLLTDKTAVNGWAGSGNIIWETVTGAVRVALVLFKDTGNVGTSPLIAYLDEGITNLPLDPTGTRVTFLPDPDSGLFRL